jgi:hypothetical protein
MGDDLKQRMAALGLDFEDEEEVDTPPKKKWFGKSGKNDESKEDENTPSPILATRADDLGIGIDIPMANLGAAREEEERRKAEEERQQKQEEWRRRQEAEAASLAHASPGIGARTTRGAGTSPPVPPSAEKERVPVLQVSVNGVEGGADLYKGESPSCRHAVICTLSSASAFRRSHLQPRDACSSLPGDRDGQRL